MERFYEMIDPGSDRLLAARRWLRTRATDQDCLAVEVFPDHQTPHDVVYLQPFLDRIETLAWVRLSSRKVDTASLVKPSC